MSISNTLADNAVAAKFERGEIVVQMSSGQKIRFQSSRNPRLAKGTPAQLKHIELSPYGLHWPDLDEDLSYRGLLNGDFGFAPDQGQTLVRGKKTMATKKSASRSIQGETTRSVGSARKGQRL